MLWPEGSAAVLSDVGAYIDPPLPDEKPVAFSVSKMGSYIAITSKRTLALFRFRPLAPLAIYVDIFPDKEIVDIVSSPSGSYLAILTNDNRIASFSVKPRHDIEEVLKITYSVTPGPGEAIGARELWLEPVSSVYTEDKGVALDSVGPQLIVYTQNEVQYGYWLDFENTDPLRPAHLVRHRPKFCTGDIHIAAGHSFAVTKGEWVCCVLTTKGDIMAFEVSSDNEGSDKDTDPEDKIEISSPGMVSNNDLKATPSPASGLKPHDDVQIGIDGEIVALDYNFRLKRLAYATSDGRIYVASSIFDPDSEPLELTTDIRQKPLTLRWTPSGTALFIGYTEGWQLLSMLGLQLYSSALTGLTSYGVVRADWMVGAEAVLMLCTDGKLRLQNMLRWGGRTSSERERPVLHGNGRLMLYYDPSSRGVTSAESPSNQSWLTVPFPTWYSAQNWPIAHICSSSDGRFVAIAGTAGIMMFNAVTRQWKEIDSNEALVRGGLCWHGRQLIAATVSPDTGTVSLQMFSPISSGANRNSSAGLFKSLWAGKSRTNLNSLDSHFDRRSNLQQPLPVGSSAPPRREEESATTTTTTTNQEGDANQDTEASQDPNDSGVSVKSANPGASPERGHHRTRSAGRRASSQDISQILGSPTTAISPSSPPTAFSSSTSLTGLSGVPAQQVVATEEIGKGPGSVVNLISVGSNGLLGVLIGVEHQRLLIYDLDRHDFELVHDLPLSNVISADNMTPAVRAFTILSESQVLLLVGTTLMLVSSLDEDFRKYQRQIVAEPIETYEYVANEKQLWVFDGQDVVATNWSPESISEDKFYATIPLDAYPVHFSTHRGVLSLVECEPVRSFDSTFAVARPTTSHEVCVQYILESALLPAYKTAVSVAAKYAKAPYFSDLLESLLYRVVTSDGSKETQANSIKSAVTLIKEFPCENFEAIVAGCARKVEMKYWPRLFEAVGKTPAELFDSCLQRSDLVTANEYLIVVQTTQESENESLSDFLVDERMLSLYKAAIAAKQTWICKQVCEFIMALDSSGSALEKFYAHVKSTM